jgi:hypothetical protein
MEYEATKTIFMKNSQHPSVPSPSESPLAGLVAIGGVENTKVKG